MWGPFAPPPPPPPLLGKSVESGLTYYKGGIKLASSIGRNPGRRSFSQSFSPSVGACRYIVCLLQHFCLGDKKSIFSVRFFYPDRMPSPWGWSSLRPICKYVGLRRRRPIPSPLGVWDGASFSPPPPSSSFFSAPYKPFGYEILQLSSHLQFSC